MIWGHVVVDYTGTSGLTFLNPLFEMGGLAEQAMNNAVLSITAMKVVSVTEHKKDRRTYWEEE